MNCEKCQNQLYELFGEKQLPDEIQKHVDTCNGCYELLTELQNVKAGLGTDEQFVEGMIDPDRMVETVNSKIDKLEISKVTSIARWKTFVPAAAALVIIVGVGFLSQIMLKIDPSQSNNRIDSIPPVLVKLSQIEIDELNKSDFNEFVDEYSYEYGFDEELESMDDLTEEQFQYLQEHLDVEEIL